MNDNTLVFTHILLNFSVLLNNAIEMFIDFLKHMRDPEINSELTTLEISFGELREYEVVFRRVYGIGV